MRLKKPATWDEIKLHPEYTYTPSEYARFALKVRRRSRSVARSLLQTGRCVRAIIHAQMITHSA